MNIQNWLKTILHRNAIFIFFISISLFSQEKENSSSEKDTTSKKFNVIKAVWATPYKSQGETGTCWCFSTTSFLESEAHRLGRGDFEISQMYIVYNAYIEKALRHIKFTY